MLSVPKELLPTLRLNFDEDASHPFTGCYYQEMKTRTPEVVPLKVPLNILLR